MISRALVRRFSTSLRRFDDYPIEGRIGGNVPFKLDNKWLIWLSLGLFFSSGFALPFYVVAMKAKKE